MSGILKRYNASYDLDPAKLWHERGKIESKLRHRRAREDAEDREEIDAERQSRAYSMGLQRGQSSSAQYYGTGYSHGSRAGYGMGLGDGYEYGHGNGYNNGYGRGRYSGILEGYDGGYGDGLEEGDEEGFEAGYKYGRTAEERPRGRTARRSTRARTPSRPRIGWDYSGKPTPDGWRGGFAETLAGSDDE